MAKTVARQRVSWCNRVVEWTAVAVEDAEVARPLNVVWSYQLDGLTFFSFPFDPIDADTTTRDRALNWLNRHHLLVRREHLQPDLPTAVR